MFSLNFAKRYLPIGETIEIPVDDVDKLSPLTGWVPTEGASAAFLAGDSLTLENKRGKYALFFINSDPVASLVVTPQVTATYRNYAAENQPIVILAEGSALVGPFSANFEAEGVVTVVTSGAAGSCTVMELP